MGTERNFLEYVGVGKKNVSFRNAFDCLVGKRKRGSKTANFIIRNCYRSREVVGGVELLFSSSLLLVVDSVGSSLW